ncbi:hypothetical protein OHA21_41730 [Actinoplanes sp. NBC_00393]|uniref:hypothetical protein n=1 Tax=Actinoplanes sp. NBC_00393 TaxID=2975953 RepID=UPI002E1F5388
MSEEAELTKIPRWQDLSPDQIWALRRSVLIRIIGRAGCDQVTAFQNFVSHGTPSSDPDPMFTARPV